MDLRRVAPRETELNKHPGRSSIFTIALFRLGPHRIDTFGTYSRATGALKDCVPQACSSWINDPRYILS